MNKFMISLSLAALLVFVPAVFAAPSAHANIGRNLNPAQCDTSGSPVLNVTFKVLNDADSGVLGNAWANDTFNKQIQAWKQADGTFCAVVRYEGQFVTYAGPSPNGTGTVAAGVKGTVSGGYMAILDGTLNSGLQTRGNLGTFDYQCGAGFTCPGAFSWVEKYFSNVTFFNQTYWAWNYRAGRNGSWVNAVTGNAGDITGN